jgi:hypothetical protein
LCEIENKLKTIISGSLQEYFGTSWLVKGLPKNTYTKAKKLADEKVYDLQLNSGDDAETNNTTVKIFERFKNFIIIPPLLFRFCLFCFQFLRFRLLFF